MVKFTSKKCYKYDKHYLARNKTKTGSHRGNMQEQINELVAVNKRWKKDYDALSAETVKLKLRLSHHEKRAGLDIDVMRDVRDIEHLKSQVRFYKKQSEQITEENKQLRQQKSLLRKQLEPLVGHLDIHVSRRNRNHFHRKTQQEIMEALSVPGIHIPGTFYALNMVRDTITS